MIKNWTVKTKQIKKKEKGLVNHFNYLKNNNKPSHFYTEIHDLNNSNEKISNILNEFENRREYRRENGLRGGGVNNYATSFVISIPRDIEQPNVEQWKKIAAITLKELATDSDIDKKALVNNSVVMLHDESNSINKASHIHILVSNVFDNEVVKPISQYQGTYAMKKGINKAMRQVMGIDNKEYVPENENVGDKPLYAARAEKQAAMDNYLEDKKNSMIEDFENRKDELRQDRKEFEDDKNKFYKAIKFARGVMSKWIKALRDDHQNELEKRAKQTAKVISDIEPELPDVAEDMEELATQEEQLAAATAEIADTFKVSHHLPKEREEREKKEKKRKRRTRKNQ